MTNEEIYDMQRYANMDLVSQIVQSIQKNPINGGYKKQKINYIFTSSEIFANMDLYSQTF